MKYMYKCRMCGTMFAHGYEKNGEFALKYLGNSIATLSGYPAVPRIPTHQIHDCEGDMAGVADLIGICDDQEAEEI